MKQRDFVVKKHKEVAQLFVGFDFYYLQTEWTNGTFKSANPCLTFNSNIIDFKKKILFQAYFLLALKKEE